MASPVSTSSSASSAHPPALVPAETQWLTTGALAYARMLALIATAQRSIRCETYIWGVDEVGARFLAALTAAAARGVRVHVLVDGGGSPTLPSTYWRDLEAAGGRAHIFNPLTFRHFSLRSHRKLLLIDDATAITGGFNIAREYDGDGVTSGWRDFGIELQHPDALHQLAASFDSLFANHLIRHSLRRQWESRSLRRPSFFRLPGPVLFSGPRFVRNQFAKRLLASLRHAQHVRIVSAYFAPGFRLRRALRAVALRGGTVELLLAGKSDVALAQRAARSIYGSLLKAGVQIWEYQPQILHAKLALVDSHIFVGTANLDARSLSINHELMIHLQDARLCTEASTMFSADLKQSLKITLDEWQRTRTWFTRFRGAIARFLLTKVDPWLARRQMRDVP
jgi:cardiolipin synthase